MREQPTIIWQTTSGSNALSTYEAYKTIDEIATLHPARLIIADSDRGDRDQLMRYAQRRHLAPALRMPFHADRDQISTMHRSGVNRMVFRIDSSNRERHDALHGYTSFGTTLRAMRFAAEERIPIEVETHLTRATYKELARIAEIITAFHASEWLVTFPVPPLQPGQEMLNAAETESALAALASFELLSGLHIRTIEAPQFVRFGGSAIRDVVFIGGNGEVRPGEYTKAVAGNVRYRPLQALAESDAFSVAADPANLHGKCGRCEFRGPCGGSRARAFAMTGDLFAPDPLCSYQPSGAA